MTLAEALQDGRRRLAEAGIEDADIEAEVLLRHALGLDRARLFSRLNESPIPSQTASFDALIARRMGHEPTPYITGHKEFFGLDFEVTPAALIPRPETELLVEEAIAATQRRPRPPVIVDVGCGCGAIACALAHHLVGRKSGNVGEDFSPPADPGSHADAFITAIDVSAGALALATRNAARLGLRGRVRFFEGDLLDPLPEPADIIVANLPYVKSSDWEALPPEVREHEPRASLDGGPSGTEVLGKLLRQAMPTGRQAPSKLRRPGLLLAEIGWDEGEQLTSIARECFPEGRIAVKKDLADLDRILRIDVD